MNYSDYYKDIRKEKTRKEKMAIASLYSLLPTLQILRKLLNVLEGGKHPFPSSFQAAKKTEAVLSLTDQTKEVISKKKKADAAFFSLVEQAKTTAKDAASLVRDKGLQEDFLWISGEIEEIQTKSVKVLLPR
jgi:hypothetical protein